MIRLLAIDPSYAGKTGYAGFTEDPVFGLRLIKYGTIKPDLMPVATCMLRQYDILVIEDQFFGKNASTLKKLVSAKCQWTVRAQDLRLSVHEMVPQVWQSKVQRRWRVGKKAKIDWKAVQQYVTGRWKVTIESNDILAAICIGSVYVDLQKFDRKQVVRT